MRTALVRAAAAAAIAAPLALFAPLALADTVSVDFENPPYTLGTINVQDGWSSFGAAGSGCAVYDHAVNSSLGVSGFGAQSLRISNAVTSGCFGDQTFSKSLANEAGEISAKNGGMSGGTRQSHFEAQFDIAAATTTQQPGLFLSTSADRGDGARMSYVGFDDQADGIHVIFYDYQDAVPYGTFATPAQGCGAEDDWIQADIATIDRTSPHTIKLTVDFVSGPRNDVVKVYVDGVLKKTGTSWEDYFRWCTESGGGVVNDAAADVSRTVDSILFRTGGGAVPATAGMGYLIDNLSLTSSTPAPASCPLGTTQASSPLETVVVNSSATTPALTVNNLANGTSYILKASGTWQNGGINVADAEYASTDNWATQMDGYDINPYFLGSSEFDLEVNGGFVDWGAYSGAHEYVYLYGGTGAPANFLIFDGDSNQGPGASNAGWYGDNSGSVSVEVYPCLPPPKVVIAKYVDGVHATAGNASSTAFPMVTSWVSSGPNGTVNNVPFTLSPSPWGGIGDPYEATYINGQIGDNYSTNEVTTGNDIVSTACGNGTPFALVGYTTGDSWAEAQAASTTLATPAFTNLQGDKYVIVWNMTCPTGPVPPPTNACETPGVAPLGWTLRNGTNKKDVVNLDPYTMFVGNGGNDVVVAGDGNYIVCTGNGNDTIKVGSGNSVIDTGAGNDTVKTGDGDMWVSTGNGKDVVSTGNGNDTIDLGSGNNSATTGAGNDTITAGSGNDAVAAGAGTDTCNLGGGNNAKASCEL